MPCRFTLLVLIQIILWWSPASAADFQKYCSSSSERWLLLIDRTDTYDSLDQKRLAEGAAAILNEIKQAASASLSRGLLFEVYSITDRPGNLSAEWSTCVPACPIIDDKEDCSDVLLQRDRRVFDASFKQRFTPFVSDPAVTPASEILRTLFLLSTELEGKRVSRMIVFSDLIEYSNLNKRVSEFSKVDAKELRATVTKRQLVALPTFKTTKITVFGAGKRLGQNNTEESAKPQLVLSTSAAVAFREFWLGYLGDIAPKGSVSIRQNYVD